MSQGWRLFGVLGVMATLAVGSSGVRRAASAEETPAKSSATPAEGVPAEESPAAAKYTLAYKFQPDQVMRFEVSQETEITTHVKDETETVRNSSTARRHFTVKAVDEKTGDADLELSIDWVHMLASFENPTARRPRRLNFRATIPASIRNNSTMFWRRWANRGRRFASAPQEFP